MHGTMNIKKTLYCEYNYITYLKSLYVSTLNGATDFQRPRTIKKLCADILYQISPKSGSKSGK